jgi:tetratricopeptide (TPR) repeat protein
LGPEHPHVAILFTNLARLYLNQKKYAEAEPLYQQALRIHEQVLGPEHPTVAYQLRGLAGLYQMQKKYVEAESSFQRTLRIREQTIGPEHPLTVETRTAYARFLRQMGRTDEAAILEASRSEETARLKENTRTDDSELY